MPSKKKPVFYTELFYVLGMLTLAFGCAFMEKANFGLSMVVAPAYLLYRRLVLIWPSVTFGMMEYIFQAFLLILMCLCIRKIKLAYLFSFVTAVLYGFLLDGTMFVVSFLPAGIVFRAVYYIVGLLLCSLGVASMLHTYISAEVYELIVKEVPETFRFSVPVFKTIYDIVSCLIALIMSFVFFGLWTFVGVNWGTVLCALVNGFLIGVISKFIDNHFTMKDLLPLRKVFEK